jgi:VIT1/CCC1 family predicted Fe2+/Mn2+ transporter
LVLQKSSRPAGIDGWREVTGRGAPAVRGAITGVATTIGGMLHTFPFLISNLPIALDVAYTVVGFALLAIVFIRYRLMKGSLPATILQVIVGGGLVSALGDFARKNRCRIGRCML